MDVKGTVRAFTTQTVKTKNGDKEKGELVIDIVDDKFPYSLAFEVWREEAFNVAKDLKVGNVVTVGYDVRSREWKDRWFTSASAWIIKKEEANVDSDLPPFLRTEPVVPKQATSVNDDLGGDQLPF